MAAPREIAVDSVTVRATLMGLAVLLIVNAWATYAEMVVRSSRLTISHFPLALFALFLTLLLSNRLLRLTSGELLVILSMGLVGAIIPVEGVVGFLLGIISSFQYFASPENQWDDFLLPFLPAWLIPQGSEQIWTQFFESGAVLDRGIPWSMWGPPLLCWAAFILVTLWVTTCMMVILRRQWQDLCPFRACMDTTRFSSSRRRFRSL